MKKFNVKALSLAVAAAVVSGAAAAEEVNLTQAIKEKNLGKAAFATVFSEGTKFDTESGKLTFKKDADALLLKTMELEQAVNALLPAAISSLLMKMAVKPSVKPLMQISKPIA